MASKSESTQRNYQSGWNHFCTWCETSGFDPDETAVSTIVDYCDELLKKRRLSLHTVRSRISAIAYFHPAGTFHGTLGSHRLIQIFVAGAKKKFMPLVDRFPAWDLPIVLNAMMAHPFEPLQELPLGILTKKTLFLVAICSARRIGELRALDCRPSYCNVGAGGVVLRTNSSFLPKVPTQINIEKAIEFTPYGIDEDGSVTPENTLCVCRALQEYLKATKDIRKTSQLFVTFKKGDQGRAASKITMAGWLKYSIKEAYEAVGKPAPAGVKAHQTRHQSTSWADLKALSILDICQQASWASPNTFVKHYRLNLTGVSTRHASAVLDAHSH
jgi:integrase